jgi:hypothetical protein
MLSRRQIALTAALLLLPVAAYADIVCALGKQASAYKAGADQRPSADTMQLVKRVNEAYRPMCLPRCPEVAILRNSSAPNLMLSVTTDEAKIVYSPEFFSGVYGKYGESGIVALIAHVYGHAIDEATQQKWLPATWNPELRADAWAGCVLAKTGLAQANLTGGLSALAATPPLSQTSWAPRASAARLGFTHCGGTGAKFDAARAATKAK